MARRIGPLSGVAAMLLSACGLRVPIPEATQSPSPVAPPASPPASPSPSATTASPSPSPSPTPSATPSPAPTPPPPTPVVVVGRPLRLRRRLLAPSVGVGEAPVHADAARLGGVPDRARLAALWLHAARMEHASVPAFADVALLLAAVGAPLDLVTAAHTAALDEVAHTTVSYAFANAYGGTTHAPGALPRLLGRRTGSRLRGRRGTLRRLAVEALRDGCLLEGYAGELAAAGADSAVDPAVAAALRGIARDEAAHAELSWRILGWCLATEPRAARAVARALRTLPRTAPVPTPDADLGAHGWPAPGVANGVFAEVRARVADRAAGLLALTPHR